VKAFVHFFIVNVHPSRACTPFILMYQLPDEDMTVGCAAG
jgi:hypothetical protein